MIKKDNKLVLCILDGFGISNGTVDNPIKNSMPYWAQILKKYPNTMLNASGSAVGLPEGQMGNSEVGHMTIGLGYVVKQDLLRISEAIENIDTNENLNNFAIKIKGNRCHIMGLYSPGGVHSHIKHFNAIVEFLASKKIMLLLHIFTDGRDTPINQFQKDLKELEKLISKFSNIKIASISGRYYAMDRDKRWERTQKIVDIIMEGKGSRVDNISEYIVDQYKKNNFDEFIEPAVVGEYKGARPDDSFLMINFRPDRIIQLLEKLTAFKWAHCATMTDIPVKINHLDVILQRPKVSESLGEIISQSGLNQCRISESEKHPHVTYFFDGGKDVEWSNESIVTIPSPKVATYDLKPEMSGDLVTQSVLENMENSSNFILVNYANADMVGHTGNYLAAQKALRCLDDYLRTLVEAAEKYGYILIITADHGNIEAMKYQDGIPHTSHTTNPVPFVLIGKDAILKSGGSLADIAPTCLHLLGLNIPAFMAGKCLIY